jgi:hypothetical protein
MVRLCRPEIYRLRAEKGHQSCGVETGLIALFCCFDDAIAQVIASELQSPGLRRRRILDLVDKYKRLECGEREMRRSIRCIYKGRQICNFAGQAHTSQAAIFPYEGLTLDFDQLIFQFEADNVDELKSFIVIQAPYITTFEFSVNSSVPIEDSVGPYGDVLQGADNVSGSPRWISPEKWSLGGFMFVAMARHIRQRWPA